MCSGIVSVPLLPFLNVAASKTTLAAPDTRHLRGNGSPCEWELRQRRPEILPLNDYTMPGAERWASRKLCKINTAATWSTTSRWVERERPEASRWR